MLLAEVFNLSSFKLVFKLFVQYFRYLMNGCPGKNTYVNVFLTPEVYQSLSLALLFVFDCFIGYCCRSLDLAQM